MSETNTLAPAGDVMNDDLPVAALTERTWVVTAARIALGLAILATWELSSGTLVRELWISKPSEIIQHLFTIIGNGQLADDLSLTLSAAGGGFVIGGVTGVIAGLILGQLPRFAAVINPFILGIYGIPKIALAPLFIIWFGIGMASKLAISSIVVFFLVFFPTYSGVRSVSKELVDMVALMGGSRQTVIKKIIMPSAAPWILSGLRMSVPYSFIGAIVAEFIASTGGIGFRIQKTSAIFFTTGTMAGVIVIVALVLSANAILGWAEKRILAWHPTAGGAVSRL